MVTLLRISVDDGGVSMRRLSNVCAHLTRSVCVSAFSKPIRMRRPRDVCTVVVDVGSVEVTEAWDTFWITRRILKVGFGGRVGRVGMRAVGLK